MSTSIKTNCSSNGSSLAALKRHINTCLRRWQEKNSKKGREQNNKENNYHCHQLTSQDTKHYCSFPQDPSCGRFGQRSSKEYSFVQRTTVCWKSFNTKLQKFITPLQQRANKNNSTTFNDIEGPLKYGRKVEIVAKLLSSTLIARTRSTSSSSSAASEETASCLKENIKVIQRSSTIKSSAEYCKEKMTISDISFFEVREEYPDLNSEIRGILMARAQEGSTISQIRDDYRKLTGVTFPIYDNVTEFLLTIPHVTAYCSEKGTRIFNILPIDKTRHIHDMIMQQKPQQEPLQRATSDICYYRERLRNQNYQPTSWRHSASRRLTENNENMNVEQQPLKMVVAEQQGQGHLVPSTDSNLSRMAPEVVYENNNCFYQDNCNYLLHRIYNQQRRHEALPPPPPPPPSEEDTQPLPKQIIVPATTNAAVTSMAINNFNMEMQSYKNNVHHLNNLYQLQHQQKNQYQQNLNNLRTLDVRRPSNTPYKTAMPISSRSSSPTIKSWYTNESVFTDSDYEAHLLDFLLLGDDFFLYMARMELRCKFKKNQRILQSGLCVSGQTIGASIRRVKAMNDQRRSIIINIGSVDIIQGRQLIQIQHEFRELLLTMLKKGFTPILTTLAPLANYNHNNQVKEVVQRFNDFVKREGQKRKLIVIDVWKCLVNEKGHVFFDCYQNEPRNVTGASESYLFWNKIGRQRVLQLIESKLEY